MTPALAVNYLPLLFAAALYFSSEAQAQVPVPGQSVTFNTGIPTGPVGGCLTASSNADGAPVVISPCFNGDPSPSNTWVAAAGAGMPGALRIFGDKCLDVTNGVNASGTQLQIWTCGSGNPNQQWVSAGRSASPQISWSGQNKCVDVTNGDVHEGNVIQIWDCDSSLSNENQLWSTGLASQPKSVSLSLASDTSLCIAASANSTSAPITVETCSSSSAAQAWIQGSSGGALKSVQNSALCLATSGAATGAGTSLVLDACTQSWDLEWQAGLIKTAAASDMCIELTDGEETAGTQLQISNCTVGNTNQTWIVSYNF